jgi:hypothetical protein
LPFAPIFEINLRAVFRGYCVHKISCRPNLVWVIEIQ